MSTTKRRDRAGAEQSKISARLRADNERALQFDRDARYQRLMTAPEADVGPLVDAMTNEDAQDVLDRLNAAPGDNMKVRLAVAVKLDRADKEQAEQAAAQLQM